MKTLHCSLILFLFGLQVLIGQTSNMKLEGNITFNYTSEDLTLGVERIVNSDSYGYSGALKLAVYFSSQPYSGKGKINGTKVFEVETNKIRAGYYHGGTRLTSEWLKKPLDGEYYVTVVLLEYDQRDERYYIVYSTNFSKKANITYNSFFSNLWDVD